MWNETNIFIEKFKLSYPNDVLTIKSENLFKDIYESKKVFKHFNLDIPSDKKIKRAIKKPINKQVTGDFYNKEEILHSNKKVNITYLLKKYDY